MEYATATAPISWISAFWLLPHFLIGLFCVISIIRGKLAVKNVASPSIFHKIIFFIVGTIFILFSVIVTIKNIKETQYCRSAEARGDYETIDGIVTIKSRFRKVGAGNIKFLIGNQEFETTTEGGCDCGFIKPLGKSLPIKAGDHVTAKVSYGKIIYYHITK